MQTVSTLYEGAVVGQDLPSLTQTLRQAVRRSLNETTVRCRPTDSFVRRLRRSSVQLSSNVGDETGEEVECRLLLDCTCQARVIARWWAWRRAAAAAIN